jgi:hypothetical protein
MPRLTQPTLTQLVYLHGLACMDVVTWLHAHRHTHTDTRTHMISYGYVTCATSTQETSRKLPGSETGEGGWRVEGERATAGSLKGCWEGVQGCACTCLAWHKLPPQL